MKSASSLIKPTLKLLAYSALGGTALIEAASGAPAGPATQITLWTALGGATLKTAGTLAGEVSGGLVQELLFGDRRSLTHKTIVDVAGEAVGRSLTNIVADLQQSQPDNAGLEKLGEFKRRHGLDQLRQHWHSFITEQLNPQLANLSNSAIQQHLNDGALLQVDDLQQLVAMLTMDDKDAESYLDDETLQQVSFCLLQTLPASFIDVLTDEHSGKAYRQRMHEMLSEQGIKQDIIISLLHQLLERVTVPPSPPQDRIEIARLPSLLTRDLFGREHELQMLDDAWAGRQTNIIVFAGFGGTGKSALVNNWVRQIAPENYRGAARVFAWSFWSQGSDQAQTSADPFIDAALRWCGDPDPAAGAPWDKGERLARLIKQARTLLILDGLEPLQHPPGPMEGQLKEPTMQALLRELAAGQPGLCVISTREPLADLLDYAPPAVVSCDLEQLSPQAGAQILRAQGIAGDEAELEQASEDFGNHALALTILSSLLQDAYGGDIRRRKEIPALGQEDDRKGRHALRVMASYEKWLSEAGEGAMLAVLRLLGLFSSPAKADAIAVLRGALVIPGLTDHLQNLSETKWQQTLAKLRRIKLLAARVATDFSLSPVTGQTKVRSTEELDAHPLVREHFRKQLQRHHPDAWREANLRLYEHLRHTTKELPDTVEEMAPLFAAVAHGCAAGRHQQALVDVYWRRIRRGEEAFSVKKLGAIGADLAALAGFFETPWRNPVAGLTAADQAFVLNQAGTDLRALGRLREAVEPMQAALQARISQEDWENAARNAGNLSELYLMLGDLPQALEFARQSVALADRSGDEFIRMATRTTLADALHQAGQAEAAAAAFRQAEEMQKQWQPEYPLLYSVRGFRYCELLLGQGRHQEVKERAARMLELAKQYGDLLSIALDNLSLGRAWLLQSGAGDDGRAAEFLQRAVDGLRQAGTTHHLPRGLLARAELRRVTGEYERARTDLDEAQRLAERSQMRLHLSDCHLEAARLCLATGDLAQARAHWATAKEMIERMGYHRRDGELAKIEAQLNSTVFTE